MDKLRAHYTDTSGSSILTDRFRLWTSSQASHESIQEWEVKVRQASSLCAYGDLTDELTRDKFIFGLNEDHTRTELLKTHVKPDNSKKSLQDVVAEARANQTNKLIVDSSKGTDEEVHWTGVRHSQMKLRREPGVGTGEVLTPEKYGFLVSRETVVLRRWGRSKQKFGFIKRVDKG